MTSASPDWKFRQTLLFFWCNACKTQFFARLTAIPMRTSIHDLHVAFQIPYLHDFIAKLRRRHSEVNQNHEKGNVRNIEHKIFKGLKFSGGQSDVTICLTNFGFIEALNILHHSELYSTCLVLSKSA
jgi:hypothetical protein